MSRRGSLAEIPFHLIADASVWINLAATGRIEAHLTALENSISITDVALRELEAGRAKGRQAAEAVTRLVQNGRVDVRSLPIDPDDVFLSLVAGAARDTLDDGEAATLACALGYSAGALIDERKATLIAATRFPSLVVISTVDILLCRPTFEALGHEAAVDSLFNALLHARMRVPHDHMAAVCALLGVERVAQCLSLPSSVRGPMNESSLGLAAKA